MTTWRPEDLTRLAESHSLVLTAGDGGGPGVEIGMAVVDGRIELGGVTREVSFTTGLESPAGLDAAFAGKYGPVSDALVASAEARAATIRIDPAP